MRRSLKNRKLPMIYSTTVDVTQHNLLIKKIHRLIASDMDLPTLFLQYEEIKS